MAFPENLRSKTVAAFIVRFAQRAWADKMQPQSVREIEGGLWLPGYLRN
jgi:hypothetical protein